VVRSDARLAAAHKNWTRLTPQLTAHLLNRTPLLISIKLRPGEGVELCCRGASDSAPMLAPLFGYFLSMITVLAAAMVLLSGLSNISTLGNGRHYPRPPVIGRTVMVETQRHSPPAAKEASPAKDVSTVVATAKADTKKIKHYKPKVLARQRNNYGNGNALGYAEEYRYGPSGLFFR
jgi:hypothetical protein